jgi:hypothetical protein
LSEDLFAAFSEREPQKQEYPMVKKKKSRPALNGMAWGALGEVTNIPKVPPKEVAPVPMVKNEEKEKWWTLGLLAEGGRIPRRIRCVPNVSLAL